MYERNVPRQGSARGCNWNGRGFLLYSVLNKNITISLSLWIIERAANKTSKVICHNGNWISPKFAEINNRCDHIFFIIIFLNSPDVTLFWENDWRREGEREKKKPGQSFRGNIIEATGLKAGTRVHICIHAAVEIKLGFYVCEKPYVSHAVEILTAAHDHPSS